MKIGRNAPCPCGSGKKYKKCCLNKARPPVDLFSRRIEDAYGRLMEQLYKFARDKLADMTMLIAAGEFLLWPGIDENPADLLIDHLELFLPWFLFNWTYDPDGTGDPVDLPAHQTIADIYADRNGDRLDSHQKQILAAINGRPFSFLEIVRCLPGHGLLLRDIFSGLENEIGAAEGFEDAQPGDMMLGRIVRVDHVVMLAGCSSILLPPGFKPMVIELRKVMKEGGRQIDSDLLIEYEPGIRRLYLMLIDHLKSPPRLQNTDGDPFLFHTVHYTIEDPREAFDKLVDLALGEDIETLKQSATLDKNGRIVRVEIPWIKRGNQMYNGWKITLLGRLKINGKKLTAEVNSESRARMIRQKIERRLGSGAVYRTTEIQSPEAVMENGRFPVGGGNPADGPGQDELMQLPEVRRQIEQMMKADWNGWVDKKLSALGNQTPRQAVKTADGREKVEALLLDARRNAEKDSVMSAIVPDIFNTVRRRLGLDVDLSPAAGKTEADGKNARLDDIKRLIEGFGRACLDGQHTGFALKLCGQIGRMRTLNIQRGRREIWAAAIVYVIARLNFLFDPAGELSITTDDICEHFGTVKSTVGNKATGIQKACRLNMGDRDFCRPEIVDMFTFYETPDGFILPGESLLKVDSRGFLPEKKRMQSGGAQALESSKPKKKKTRSKTSRGKKTADQRAGKKKAEAPLFRQLKLFDDV